MDEKKSVIRPDDIFVQTDIHRTFLSRRVSDLAAAILSDPPDRTKPAPGGSYYQIETFEEIKARREKVDKLLKKYEEKI
jgi:hypothetical protein